MKILLLALTNKYIQGGIIGLIAGYYIGSIWVGKDQDEMMRQMTMVVMIARGN